MLHSEMHETADRIQRLSRIRYAADTTERSIDVFMDLDIEWREVALTDGTPGGMMRRIANGTEESVIVQWQATSGGQNVAQSIAFLDCDCVVTVRSGNLTYTTSSAVIRIEAGDTIRIPCGAKFHAQWSGDAETVTTYFRAERCGRAAIKVL